MPTIEELEAMEVGVVASHFLDSGAFTQWTLAQQWSKEHDGDRWGYYETQEHFDYLDSYAEFIKKYIIGIDLYANVDVIPTKGKFMPGGVSPDEEIERAERLSWRNLRYFEKKHGLHPVPVVHYRAKEEKWLRRHIEAGYEIIGLGGLVGSTMKGEAQGWLDRCFNIVCDNPKRLPCAKMHGFGVTNYDLLLRYPWWSVDSTSWTKCGAYGAIAVPHKRNGQFSFKERPYVIKVSKEPSKRKGGKGAPKETGFEVGGESIREVDDVQHYDKLTDGAQAVVLEWLDLIGIPLGVIEDGEIKSFGVSTRHTERRAANILFFERMRESLPEYPWPFTAVTHPGFGL